MIVCPTFSGHSLRYASRELKRDRDIVMLACRAYGFALQHACRSLRDDAAVVTASVMQNGHALQHAGPQCRKNFDIVLEAVAQQRNALKHALEIDAFKVWVRSHLNAWDVFVHVFLSAVRFSSRDDSCGLFRLNGHTDTLCVLVAEFAGIRFGGRNMTLLRAGAAALYPPWPEMEAEERRRRSPHQAPGLLVL